jgi:hypothetical protein
MAPKKPSCKAPRRPLRHPFQDETYNGIDVVETGGGWVWGGGVEGARVRGVGTPGMRSLRSA